MRTLNSQIWWQQRCQTSAIQLNSDPISFPFNPILHPTANVFPSPSDGLLSNPTSRWTLFVMMHDYTHIQSRIPIYFYAKFAWVFFKPMFKLWFTFFFSSFSKCRDGFTVRRRRKINFYWNLNKTRNRLFASLNFWNLRKLHQMLAIVPRSRSVYNPPQLALNYTITTLWNAKNDRDSSVFPACWINKPRNRDFSLGSQIFFFFFNFKVEWLGWG